MKSFNRNDDQYPYVNAILHVKDNINNKMFDININLSSSVLDLKKEIEYSSDNLSSSNIRLVSSGHLLNDFFSLYSQGIQNNSIIFIIQRSHSKIESELNLEGEKENETTENFSNSTIIINVYLVQPVVSSIKIIKIQSYSSISKLESVFPKSTFIFKREILDKKQTFDYYGISNNDSIASIGSSFSQEKLLIDKIIKKTSDYDEFKRSIEINKSKNYRNELARKIDFKYTKIELSKKRYLRTFNDEKINNRILMPKETKISSIKLNIEYEKPSRPSTKRLPFYRKYND